MPASHRTLPHSRCYRRTEWHRLIAECGRISGLTKTVLFNGYGVHGIVTVMVGLVE